MGSTRAKIVISIVVSAFVLLGIGIALTHDPKPIARIDTANSSSGVVGKSWADLGAAEFAALPAGTQIVDCTPTQQRLQPGAISSRAPSSPQEDPGFHFLIDGRCAYDPSAVSKPMRVDWLEGKPPLKAAWWWTPIFDVKLSTLPAGTRIVNCWGNQKKLPPGVRIQVGMNFAKDYPNFHFLSDGRCAFFSSSTASHVTMEPTTYDLQWFGTGLAGTPRVGNSVCFSGDPRNNHCGIETNLTSQLGPALSTKASTLKFTPKITVTPSSNLHGGEQVLVKVVGGSPGESFRISECGSSTDANVYGCGDQLALQPFIDTDSSGSGSITFYAKVNAAIGPNNTTGLQSCKDQCVIMAHGVDIFGRSTVVYAPLKFAIYKTSPYPATLKVQRGLFDPFPNNGPAWGTKLTPTQAKWVTLKSVGLTYRWGVWMQNDGTASYPVRSTDGGANWMAAGPQLATDWAGGGIYSISRVISESSASAVMTNNAVIDVTIDSGRNWFQYLNYASDWLITAHYVSGNGIELRIGPANNSSLPKASYAIYSLDVPHLQWRRIAQSLR